jgi:hypothetical protein
LRNAKLVYHLQNLMLSDRMMHNLRKAAIALGDLINTRRLFVLSLKSARGGARMRILLGSGCGIRRERGQTVNAPWSESSD